MQHPIQVDAAGGEYMEAVVILEWLRPVGAPVKAGEHIVTVETAKAATEVAAPADGVLAQVNYAVGEEAPLGAVLGVVSDRMEEVAPAAAAPTPGSPAPAPAPTPTPAAPDSLAALRARHRPARRPVSPLARRRARDLGVDLAAVTGTGPHGRIRRRDIEAAASAGAAEGRASDPGAGAGAAPLAAPARRMGLALPVVMIHGFGADRASWRPLLAHMEGAPVLVDLPGHGAAPAPPGAGLEDLAFAVADALHAQGVEAAHLVGHSLGGAVAIALADLGLVAARSLALIAPAGLGPEIDSGFLRGLVQARRAEELQPWLERMVADPARLPAGFAQAVLRQRAAQGNGAALLALADALFAPGTQLLRTGERLARLDMPAKVIWGRADRIIPASHAADLPGHVALHRLAGVGHVPQLEAPALVARLLRELHRAAD